MSWENNYGVVHILQKCTYVPGPSSVPAMMSLITIRTISLQVTAPQ